MSEDKIEIKLEGITTRILYLNGIEVGRYNNKRDVLKAYHTLKKKIREQG